ncbi:MAG: GTP pyrophosphokinase [Deltaproteobacteria bacterium RIFCSPLOWO2_12_FULL_44_12]|nr:MAG: GTP pyrophosphokinase [Deltaproteobacteria bacterium RIFCSPHIGHO2_01_FULL_43_49]OGQ15708.1 MAG: GTP pyrophosphokinase [Deltaproteobacteria bacterium RIFCSPHIGHO2_02_FULL_44_53]OGQ28677.1 MAG: GTP pyrophosphokinase [Deltaproteobacteria bacterium RIFCSPHIGHO2_12_FULL_44_21]OGQ32000.1 MAG: GTP pyrophosphokinase [Deltaproteobacteria bacterium RIFCSPLOWO2_01_FULL_45_74]OGQ43613.1 MAG: GTP pyrophosphokinase [Deltaproteobacteria bacterium RIFCSPLOWO2_02_FULL_44_34]OGQ70172.1 MAG: GTP pyrophos
MLRLDDLLETVASYNSDADFDLIKKAYVFSAKAHEGQMRRSGEPYLIHPLGVACLLAQMRLDVPSIAAALLHDTVEDTKVTLEEVERLFGLEVKSLVDGVTKLGKIKFNTSEERQAENFRKMIMAMAQDIRVILVKLADRVHNMRTLEHMPEEKQREIAQESLDIYAPIANRLGIQEFKVELEDLCLKYLKPDIYRMIDEQVSARKERREKYIAEVKKLLQQAMKQHSIPCEVTGRLKHYHSIHRKMESQNIPFDEVHDIIAFRILLDSVQQCYEALGIIHSIWKPIPGRFKDYIAMPKGNNYQSLHTTIIGPEGERVEFQIRTREMHDIAEHGIAAHWKYKEGKLAADTKDEMKFKWIRRLLEWQTELKDPAEFLDTVKLDLFADDVYIFTPKGELKELPRGSTPIDFAYSVHTEVGHCCVGARVNGKIVPLSYKLRSGDSVEIITRKDIRPNRDWLQFVKTSKAKAKVRQYLKQEEHTQSKQVGWELLEKAALKYGLTVNKLFKEPAVEKFGKENGLRDSDSILVALGYGKILPEDILQIVLPKEKMREKVATSKETAFSKLVSRIKGRSKGLVRVSGVTDMLISFGKCCNPVPGDPITGYVTRGKGVSVHVSDCPKLFATDPDRRIDVEWDKAMPISRIAKIKVVCADRPGMLKAMTEAITSNGVNIAQATARTSEDQKAVNTFDVEITGIDQLRHVLKSLEKVKGIISVERVRS